MFKLVKLYYYYIMTCYAINVMESLIHATLLKCYAAVKYKVVCKVDMLCSVNICTFLCILLCSVQLFM